MVNKWYGAELNVAAVQKPGEGKEKTACLSGFLGGTNWIRTSDLYDVNVAKVAENVSKSHECSVFCIHLFTFRVNKLNKKDLFFSQVVFQVVEYTASMACCFIS